MLHLQEEQVFGGKILDLVAKVWILNETQLIEVIEYVDTLKQFADDIDKPILEAFGDWLSAYLDTYQKTSTKQEAKRCQKQKR